MYAMKNNYTFLFFLFPIFLSAQSITIATSSFHPAVVGKEFGKLETTTAPDSGGVQTIWLRNSGIMSDSITALVFTNNKGDTVKPFALWQWPLTIPAGGLQALQAKGLGQPYGEGDTLNLQLQFKNSNAVQQVFQLKKSVLRLANIIPSQDKKNLYIYLRNDHLNSTIELEKIVLNNDTFSIGLSSAISIVGGNSTIKPTRI